MRRRVHGRISGGNKMPLRTLRKSFLKSPFPPRRCVLRVIRVFSLKIRDKNVYTPANRQESTRFTRFIYLKKTHIRFLCRNK